MNLTLPIPDHSSWLSLVDGRMVYLIVPEKFVNVTYDTAAERLLLTLTTGSGV